MIRATFRPSSLHSVFAAVLCFTVVSSSFAGFIRGSVSAQGKLPTHSVRVAVYKKDPITLTYNWLMEVETEASTGAYIAASLDDGFYRVLVLDPVGYYAVKVFEESYLHSQATPIEVKSGLPQIDPVDFQVEQGATITGRVQSDEGEGPNSLEGITVTIEEVTDAETMQLKGAYVAVSTDAQGFYAIGLRPGIYCVDFWDYSSTPQWATQIYSNAIANEWATPVVLTNIGHKVTDVDAVMLRGFIISGSVTVPSGLPIGNVAVSTEVFQDETGKWGTVGSEETDAAGGFSINLPPGTYRMYFHDSSLLFERKFWNNQSSQTDASVIVVTDSNVSGINVQLEYTPLARWALSHSLDPFSNVEGWLGEDHDLDGYDNFHEFAFGTDPKNPRSGTPIEVNLVDGNVVRLSALFHQNVSTAYWLQYELHQKTNLIPVAWLNTPLWFSSLPATDPVTYIQLSTNLPTVPDPSQFFRLRAKIYSQ